MAAGFQIAQVISKNRLYQGLNKHEFNFLGFDKMGLFQPTDCWCLKVVRGSEKKLSARDLKMDEHFVKKDLSSLPDVHERLQKFLQSLGMGALALTDSNTKIALQRLVVSFKIMESLQMLLNGE